MPRPSAYSHTRRLVMQAAMTGVLLATVGAAALLVRSRERRWAVVLTVTPHLTERVAMRLPRGWRVDETPPGVVPLTVTAKQGPAGGEVRWLEVVQVSTGADSAGALLDEYLATQPGVPGAAAPFSFLGQSGAAVPFVAHYRESPLPQVPPVEAPEWYAATVLPGEGEGGRALGVVLHLGGLAAGGPSGQAVLRQVADGLSLRVYRAARGTGRGS